MITLDGNNLNLEKLVKISRGKEKVTLSSQAKRKLKLSHQIVEEAIKKGEPVYGITTGVGKLVSKRISQKDIGKFQKKLILSHAVGVGEVLNEETVRAVMVLRANMLARGYSGVREKVVETLLKFLNHNIIPWVPSRGSVGASGDLAPLAHIALALIGEGGVFYQGKLLKSSQVLKSLGIKPLKLEAKEALALINGTQATTAVLSLGASDASGLLTKANYVGALSFIALGGIKNAIRPEISQLRPHEGQLKVARELWELVASDSKGKNTKIQDAYSLRCMPQIHGAVWELLNFVKKIIKEEINAITDNPIIFKDKILSGGNFHGQILAFAADILTIGLSTLAAVSERRTFRLLSPELSGLPPFLTKNSGLNSGLMMLQATQAALVARNRILSHPASVDSIPTSGDQEDFVSMSMEAALKAREVLENSKKILSLELIAALQGIDLRKISLAGPLQVFYKRAREKIPPLQEDRLLQKDIEAAVEILNPQ